MTSTADAPSHSRFSHFRCEEGVIVNVNRRDYTVTVETRHTAKTIADIIILAPYLHYENGEGIHHLPEVGAICMLAFPNDNTPPFVLGYKPSPAALTSDDQENPAGADTAGEPVDQAVSFRARRMDLNPGDIALATRDENFIVLRRGGVVQIGATPIAQRVYIPVLNYIRDFAENYRMDTFGGDVSWEVGRVENDPGGEAPASYTFHLNTYAQDEKATVRIRHMPLAAPGGGERAAWEVHVAPQNIDRDTGEVVDEVYSLSVMTDGEKTEFMGANRTVTVEGDDSLTVTGTRTVDCGGDHEVTATNIKSTASQQNTVAGATVKLTSTSAATPAVKGTELVTILSSLQCIAPAGGGPAPISPAIVAQLSRILSTKVFLE